MVDVADEFYVGGKSADDVLKKINRNIIGKRGRSGYLEPIRPILFFCYNFAGHKNGQRVVETYPGKCSKCGRELEKGESKVSL